MKKLQILSNKIITKRSFSFFCFFSCVIFILLRVRYGIELTDESWYIAEPYLVAQGAIPYVDSWSQAPGFTIPLFLVYKIFLLINGGTEGIVLFARYLYCVWVFAMILIMWRFIGKRFPLILYLPLCLFSSPLFTINYNTIGVVYMFMGTMLLFSDLSEITHNKKEFINSFCAGIILARGIIGTPVSLGPCILIIFILLCQKRYTSLLGYISGGVLFTALIVLYCSARGNGIEYFFRGIFNILHDGAYFKIKSQINVAYEIKMVIEIIALFLFYVISLFLTKSIKCTNNKNMPMFIFALFVFGLFLNYRPITSLNILTIKPLALYIHYTFVALLIFMFFKNRTIKDFGLIIVSALFYVYYFLSCATNIYGMSGREYILIVPCMISLFVTYDLSQETSSLRSVSVLIFALLLCISISLNSWRNIYRDFPIRNLTQKVESGIWKGCYTTPDHVNLANFLEVTIRSMTHKTDKILFMDWASFGYLMSNGKAFTSTALDNMAYSYQVNNSEIMYDYYNLKKDMPDKIIYIDFLKNDSLSIENPNWRFNSFVNANYRFTNIKRWKQYRILLFVRISTYKQKAGFHTEAELQDSSSSLKTPNLSRLF